MGDAPHQHFRQNLDGNRYATYRTFPPELYQRFLGRYVTPYAPATVRGGIDLGGGSGGMLEQFSEIYPACTFWGVDISPAAIDASKQRQKLSQRGVQLLLDDMMNLVNRPELKEKF